MGKTVQVSGFPFLVPADEVKRILEYHTGKGTIYALEVRKSKSGSRPYASVQFTTQESAEEIMYLGSTNNLWYGKSYLRTWAMNVDMVPKPKRFAFDMEGITLDFGCQVSKEIFCSLCQIAGVHVKFGFGLRKLYFILSYAETCYKLQLSYENIWQVDLRKSPSTAKFLIIQLFGAPRIFEKVEDSFLNFYSEIPDDQWVRTTDFTPSFCIGRSSHLCLKLPYGIELPNLHDYFAVYKESDYPLRLQNLPACSQNLNLVPIVVPPARFQLPYKIVFKICSLVQNGCIPWPVLDTKFFELVNPQEHDIASIESVLEKLYHWKDFVYDPTNWIKKEYQSHVKFSSPTILLDDGLIYVRRVQITPSKVYFSGPEVNMSNRVLRHYRADVDNFLRVSFVDEEMEKLYSTDLSTRAASLNEENKTRIYRRILSVLRDGIVIGSKKFEFLAFSSSQLRDNSTWMFASRDGLTASDIRRWMGDFHSIKNVAKYAARLGQSFGSSKESLSVERHEVEIIPDIEVLKGGTKYVFSDGIGKISAEFAQRVAIKCGFDVVPSAFQIRYGGYKGVVAIDPTSSVKLSLRMSMCKFESENIKLDILATSKYQPCYMNRQIITLLSTLGVKDQVFEKKQKAAVDLLDSILTDPMKAEEALEFMSPGENTNILKEMLMCGYKPDTEPFLVMMLQVFRASKLLELRTKTRIYIPEGRSMMGCLDETRTLQYGQVFIQFSSAHRNGSGTRWCEIVKGKVVVAKNPCLHPGDVRVLIAVDVPALHHMVDCVVFPQKGDRPHPNECSGSDLDGDIYFVCWDPDLIPPKQIEPMDYTPAPSTQLDHDVTIEEVEEYFTNYIVNDSLGIIANAHTVFADSQPNKAMSQPCVELAKLFAVAVDFPKTGVPAEIPQHLRVKEYPDFMEKADKTTYESANVIGKLFREVKDIAPRNSLIRSFSKEVARLTYDADMEVDGFEDYVDAAFDYKTEYDYKLGNLMDYYGIKTEAELLSGSIMKMSRSFDRRNDAEAVSLAVKSLRKEARNWFRTDRGDPNVGNDDAKASAWYHVTYHHSYWGAYNQEMKRDHFLSFPWCVYDRLIEIKKRKQRMRVRLERLRRGFSRGLNLG